MQAEMHLVSFATPQAGDARVVEAARRIGAVSSSMSYTQGQGGTSVSKEKRG
jgi:hypothetical protein